MCVCVCVYIYIYIYRLPRWLNGKESACQCMRHEIPGLGRYPGKENGNPLQYSYLGNPMDRGGWWTKSRGLQKSQT